MASGGHRAPRGGVTGTSQAPTEGLAPSREGPQPSAADAERNITQRLPAELNSLRVKNGPSSRDDVLQLFFHETLMIRGGWNFSDSWPAKLRAGDSASRVHLTCNSRGAP